MHGNPRDIASLNPVIKLSKQKKYRNLKIVYCPPYTLLDLMKNKIKNSKLKLGAQNCHTNSDYGAFTGSVNASMIKNSGANYVIIGHSENRQSGESNQLINLKIKSALKSGLKIIFCIGETLREKRKKITKKILDKQLKLGLNKINSKKDIIIAYEPVWSIGTGLIPKSDDLYETVNFIKKKMRKNKVLYGGSVNPKNINDLKSINNIDGYLIGGASQDPKKFIDIIKKRYS